MTDFGRVAIASGLGLGAIWLVRRVVDSGARESTAVIGPALALWEREAISGGLVGVPEGHDPAGVDELAVGRGAPEDYCFTLAGLGGSEDEDTPVSCVVDPLTDPRFAPVDRGVPHSSFPSSSTWPVLTSHGARLVVSYWTAGGVRGYSGRAFAAKRSDSRGDRKHAGVDLFANEGDVVVVPEDGHVLTILPFNAGTWAVYIRSTAGDRVLNLGEVAKGSWREFGVAPGQQVRAGQPVARIGVQARGSTMLHFEAYGVDGQEDEVLVAAIRGGQMRWRASYAVPTWLRDPTPYLVMAARRTYQSSPAAA